MSLLCFLVIFFSDYSVDPVLKCAINSSHHLSQKTGIYRTFQHRINTIITEEDDKKAEQTHVKKALKRCGHPNWTLNPKTRDEKKEKLETIESQHPIRQGNIRKSIQTVQDWSNSQTLNHHQ
jgi:hypothetical protein